MKQMSLIEMDGFLKGKCIPSDLKVNETNAEYLVRKFGELESKLETALRECSSAGITIDNLEAKCAKMAAENTSLKQSEKEFNDFCREEFSEWEDDVTETPATDAFLAEVRAQGVDAAIEAAKIWWPKNMSIRISKRRRVIAVCTPVQTSVGKVEMTEWLVDFAAQLRKGGNQ